jgi:hypothetical protein
MPTLIAAPSIVEAAGNKPKIIPEFVRSLDLGAGQAVLAQAGEWVQYSTPQPDGAEYLSVCPPAFSPQLVHRDDQ